MSPETINGYSKTLRRLADSLYPTPLLDATPQLLLTWQHSRAHASAGHIAGEVARIKQFYRWCRRPMHWITDSPAEDLVAPRVPRRRPRPVPEDDVVRALIYCPDTDLRMWLILMRYAGLRCCEVAGFSRDWIIEDGEPRLSIIGKGSKQRVVPVDPELVLILKPWMDRQGRLFRHADGTPVTSRYVSDAVVDHLRSLGMPYTGHQLRHSFGSRSLDKIKDLRVVQEMMGHQNPETTALYTQVSSTRSRELAAFNGSELRKVEDRRRAARRRAS